MSKFSIKAAIAATISIGLAFATVGAAEAAPRVNEKVTICHRTHATTNPYRQITVSMSSIVGNGNSGNGHGDTTSGGGQDDPDVTSDHSHNPYYTAAGSIFNPTFAYPANQKKWQDIIPPFNYVPANGNPGTFAGLNWTEEGKAIYYGYTYNGRDYSGLCSKMSAKQFAETENAAMLSDNPNANNADKTAFKRDILQDAKDQAADEDGNLNSNTFDNLPNPSQKPKGPKVPSRVKTLKDDLDTYNTANPNSKKQAIAGVVWLDADRDGVQDDSENLFENVGIELYDPLTGAVYSNTVSYRFNKKVGNISTAGFSIRSVSTAFTVYTDASGYFLIDNVPEGDWTVKVITPTGYSYTYDSNGTSDGSMPGTYVPSGGLGFAWAGLVSGPQTTITDPNSDTTGTTPGTTTGTTPGTTTGTTPGSEANSGDSLANTGSQVPYLQIVMSFLLTLAGGYIVSRRR